MKKYIALLLALVMVFALAACGKGGNPNQPGAKGELTDVEDVRPDFKAPAEPDVYKVAMVTDYGDITDQSFNQTTYEACKAFCEANEVDFTYFKPTDNSDAARVKSIQQAAAEGYNVVVLPGYAFAPAIVEVAPQLPDVKFVALDVAEGDLLAAALGDAYDYNPNHWNLYENVEMGNVYCAVYQEELCGYMAGYAAVKLGYDKLGFLGGMAVPAVQRYGYGFVQGADAAAAELGKTVDIKYAYGNQFFGDADITAAMDTWYADGTEVVFACGGGIFTSVVEAATKVDGKVIGVDVDQAAIIDGMGKEGMTVTSAMKGLYVTTMNALEDIVLKGDWAKYQGNIATLGLVSGDDPEANYVQIPMGTTQWGEGFTQDDYKALVAAMFDGTIKVSNDISAMPATTAANVQDLGNIK